MVFLRKPHKNSQFSTRFIIMNAAFLAKNVYNKPTKMIPVIFVCVCRQNEDGSTLTMSAKTRSSQNREEEEKKSVNIIVSVTARAT